MTINHTSNQSIDRPTDDFGVGAALDSERCPVKGGRQQHGQFGKRQPGGVVTQRGRQHRAKVPVRFSVAEARRPGLSSAWASLGDGLAECATIKPLCAGYARRNSLTPPLPN